MFAFKVAAVDLKSADCNGAVRAGRAEPCHCGRSWELCHRICDIIVFIRIPETKGVESGSVLKLAKGGIQFLQENPMIMTLIFFMSGVNLVASAFDATLPGYVLPNPKGGSSVLGLVTSCAGIAMILGSLLVSVLPKPKDRVRVIYLTMLFSLGTENFVLAFSREPVLWCIGQLIGWILVPVMSANLDVILRTNIPVDLQGRVYACRNTFQFLRFQSDCLPAALW